MEFYGPDDGLQMQVDFLKHNITELAQEIRRLDGEIKRIKKVSRVNVENLFNVGDECKFLDGTYGIVTGFYGEDIRVMARDGTTNVYDIYNLQKTGNRFENFIDAMERLHNRCEDQEEEEQ